MDPSRSGARWTDGEFVRSDDAASRVVELSWLLHSHFHMLSILVGVLLVRKRSPVKCRSSCCRTDGRHRGSGAVGPFSCRLPGRSPATRGRPVRARRAPRGQAADQGHPARRRQHLHRGPVPGRRERGAGGERRGQTGGRRLHDDDGDDGARVARRDALLTGRPAPAEVPPARRCRPGAALPAVHARTRSGRRRSRVPGAVAGDRRAGHDGGRGGGRRQGPLPARRGRVLHAQAGRALPGGDRPLGPASWRSCSSAG